MRAAPSGCGIRRDGAVQPGGADRTDGGTDRTVRVLFGGFFLIPWLPATSTCRSGSGISFCIGLVIVGMVVVFCAGPWRAGAVAARGRGVPRGDDPIAVRARGLALAGAPEHADGDVQHCGGHLHRAGNGTILSVDAMVTVVPLMLTAM